MFYAGSAEKRKKLVQTGKRNSRGGAISWTIDAMKPVQQTFTIQEVSKRLDLPKSTLRFWEKEFDSCILPERTSGGQRRYGSKDVLILETISNMKKQGLTLADIKHHLAIQEVNEKGMDMETIEKLAGNIAGAVRREIIKFFQQGA